MSEKYLVINAGSSSLKFSLYEMPDAKEIVNGVIEKIGEGDSVYTLKFAGKKVEKSFDIPNHTVATEIMLKELLENNFINDLSEIKAVGHRIVHGGEFYSESVLIDNEVLDNIKYLTKFAPSHHPSQIAGVVSIQNYLPNIPQVAVFDTAFHQTIPENNYLYAVPWAWREEYGVRKYGFHGTSHKYITETLQDYYGKKDVNLIVCHIGSGASICCVKKGKSYDTTMGMTPLDGIPMGTRSGSIDPSIIQYMCKEKKLTIDEIITILNKDSGLKGICGKNDLRDVQTLIEQGNKHAVSAMDKFESAIIQYIAQYYMALQGKVDALVFTAGVGENAIKFREDIVEKISVVMGIRLNKEENNKIAKFLNVQRGIISTEDSKFDIMVIPTNEEYMILKDTYKIATEYCNKKGSTRVLK